MADTRLNLDSLPNDVLFFIVSSLDCHDFTQVNWATYKKLWNEMFSKQVVKVYILSKLPVYDFDCLINKYVQHYMTYTKEGRMAFSGEITFRQAIQQVYNIKKAVASASPYSAAILAYGTDFIYQDGILCYLSSNEIRLLDVHKSETEERVLNIISILSQIFPDLETAVVSAPICLLNYSAGILAILVHMRNFLIPHYISPWLIVLDTTSYGELLFQNWLPSTGELFVCFNRSFLFYGTMDVLQFEGIPRCQWWIYTVDLKNKKLLTERPTIIYHEIVQSQIRWTYRVFQNHLYLVSDMCTKNGFNFMSACLPPTRNPIEMKMRPIWHHEHSSVLEEICLQVDKTTGELMITDIGYTIGTSRAYYSYPLPLPTKAVMLNDLSSKPQTPPPRTQIFKHIEETVDINSYTKEPIYEGYNSYALAFLDLILDLQNQIRVRINPHNRRFSPDSGEILISQDPKLWPPDNAPKDMIDFFSGNISKFHDAQADERSIIYSVKIENNPSVIMLISFDPKIRISLMHHVDEREKHRRIIRNTIPQKKQPNSKIEKAGYLTINQRYQFR
jgi:hypothetical protein